MRIEGAVDVSAMLRSGIYFLVHCGAIVYIGKSKLMLTRVYSHRSSWGRKRTESQPKGILFDEVHVMSVSLDEVDYMERLLIARYKPRYNAQYNNGLPPELEYLVASLVAQAPTAPMLPQKVYRRF